MQIVFINELKIVPNEKLSQIIMPVRLEFHLPVPPAS